MYFNDTGKQYLNTSEYMRMKIMCSFPLNQHLTVSCNELCSTYQHSINPTSSNNWIQTTYNNMEFYKKEIIFINQNFPKTNYKKSVRSGLLSHKSTLAHSSNSLPEVSFHLIYNCINVLTFCKAFFVILNSCCSTYVCKKSYQNLVSLHNGWNMLRIMDL